MGIATEQSHTNKLRYKSFLNSFEQSSAVAIESASHAFFETDAHIDIAHPINKMTGGTGYFEDFIHPLYQAFSGLQRQNSILLGGQYLDTEWVTTTGYYTGHFNKPWLNIAPSHNLAFLRFGEFHQIKNDKVVASQIFLGIAELIIALGRWPLAPSQGYEGVVPGPATQDGLALAPANRELSTRSGKLVESMLMQLTSEDAAWRQYWDEKMLWYGPGGFGSYATIDAFHDFQVPFEKTFEGWGDGRQDGISGVGIQCKSGDGNYAFLSGWPAITGIQRQPFMGIDTTNTRIYLRDCDWWRCQNGKIMENWCMVDTLHLAKQLGRDVIEEIG